MQKEMSARQHFISRMEDIELMMITQDEQGLNEYGLSLNYSAAADEWIWLLSSNKPEEKIVMRGSGNKARFFFEYKDSINFEAFEVISPMEQVALKTLFQDWFNCEEAYDVL
jgi:hypothetical protein